MRPHENQAELQRALGWDRLPWTDPKERQQLRSYIALQLASHGLLADDGLKDFALAQFSHGLLENWREKTRMLVEQRCPVDQRIESFLNRYFADQDLKEPLVLPAKAFVLDRHGMARELSLPAAGDVFQNRIVESRRCANGILNNPVHDRRTTQGTFHVVEGGLPIAGDKRVVPKSVFVKLLRAAINPPRDLMVLPYTAETETPAHAWVSLMLRPLVCPEVEGYCRAKTMETRFFVPGSLVSNLDFVESIFGNAGDPLVPRNDAALDVESWSGHTGCVILAPHLITLTKEELGLPHVSEATVRQITDGMCWADPDDCYNNGTAFKLTCRDESGTVVTLIADNYYGYCKKEVKTQLSYAANLMGGVEEEHAGGALAFASYSLGDEFRVNSRRYNGRTFADVARDYHSFVEVQSDGYGIDKNYPSVIYIPENAFVSLIERCVKWETTAGSEHRIALSPESIYIAPSGYQIRLEKHPAAPSWRLVGTVGEGIFCHKPSTVSGGGKSEISKSLRDYMLYGPIFVADQESDFETLDEIFSRNYQARWNSDYTDQPQYVDQPSRSLLDPGRSLGSTIKLLIPSSEYSDEYNTWLRSISNHIYSMALIIKRFIKPGMEQSWRDHFGVDIVNGTPGHELKLGGRSLVGTYLRVGLHDTRWRTFKLRQDFAAAAKVQREDDISASVVLPADRLSDVGPGIAKSSSYKFVENCEYRLFQRPDDAVHRGLDKQTEKELAEPGNFISNFQGLTPEEVRELVDDVMDFDLYTRPMKKFLKKAAKQKSGYVVASSHPRIVDGKPTKNQRFLQDRPDMVKSRETYVADRGMRLFRALSMSEPVHMPVGAVLSGRRNNPPDHAAGIRSLAVYNPLHYQELPELAMDAICSLTGKSPSTTGAGSEGALTKGPFNCLVPSIDLNNWLVGMILTGLGGFSTPAGHIGERLEVGHDISLLIPEVWCRMGPEEREPATLIGKQMLEKVDDFEHHGCTIPASRLGYRMGKKFLRNYLSRVFDNPEKVFTPEILKPELQNLDDYADGILHIAEAQQKVAERYLDNESFQLACPPLQAILSIMATGDWHGLDAQSPEVREMFTREYLLSSDWYRARLVRKREIDIAFWKRNVDYLKAYLEQSERSETAKELKLKSRLEFAEQQEDRVSAPGFVEELVGTLGADPMRAIVYDAEQVSAASAVRS
jgi:hypothetical protein